MNISIPAGYYSTQSITSSTNKRDVSQLLEVWAHKETPLLNRISWGEESGGLIIEWLHEHLGWGYVEVSAALASGGTVFQATSGIAGLTMAEQTKQIRVGTLMFGKGVADSGEISGDFGWFVCTTIGSSYSVTGAWIASTKTSLAASAKFYIVGSFANEGSDPDRDTSRKRTLLSNKMTILRKDIRMTGSQMSTDMHAVASELQHQTAMRILELQFERERSVLLSWGQDRAADAEGLFKGMLQLLREQNANDWVDISTTSLSESGFNDLVASIAEHGGRPDVVVGPYTQVRKFTGWGADRIRSRPDDRVGGQYVTSYLTDTGITLDLVPLPHFPSSLLFVLDTNKIKLRAKKGRKLVLEKLGKTGDYDQWQLLSEYSLEHHGVAQGHHGGFLVLA